MGVLQSFLAGLAQAWDVFKPSDQILAQYSAEQTLTQDILRQLEMKRYLDAYNGVYVDPLLHDPADTMDTVRVNKIRPIIDTSVSYLFDQPPKMEIPKQESVDGVKIEGDSEDSPEDSTQETWLKECLNATDWPIFLLDSGTNGGICGTAYVKFIPPNEERGETYPKLQVLDPACMAIQWDARDISHIVGYIWQFDTWGKDEHGKTIPIVVRQRFTEQDDATWLIIDEWAEKSSNYDMNVALIWHEDGRTEWPYKWSPVLHCKNLPAPNEVYGDPDLDATVIEANERINFLFSNWVRILKHHAHPRIYLQGNRGAAAELIKLGPKAIWDIPDGNAKVGQLNPAIDGSQSAMAIDEITEEIQERTQTPAVALGMLPQGRDVDMSGVSLRVKLDPLVRKTERKRKTYGGWIVEICRRLFDMGNFGDDIKVTLIWGTLLPIDPVADHQVALMRQQLRVPDNVIQEDLGLDYETNHQQWIAQQKELQDLGLDAAGAKGPNGQGPASQMTPAGSQVKGAGASKNDTGPSQQKQQSPGMKGTPANNSR